MLNAVLDPTLQLVIAFLIGIASGACLIVLIYLLIILITIRKRNYIIKAQNENISEKDVTLLIDNCKEQYKLDFKSEDKEVRQGALKRNIFNLAEQIARLYFPNSKRPLAELTIDEMMMLDRYIVDRIEEIIDRPGLRVIKKLKLNSIIELSQTKKKIEDSKPMQMVEKYKLKKFIKGTIAAINCINPIYWIKKLLIDNVIARVIYKIKLMVISISGQEVYKIYSKKVFEGQDELTNKDLKEIEKELKEMQNDKE